MCLFFYISECNATDCSYGVGFWCLWSSKMVTSVFTQDSRLAREISDNKKVQLQHNIASVERLAH